MTAVACVGDDAETKSDPQDDGIGEAASAVTACRSIALHAEVIPPLTPFGAFTYLDDKEQPTPSVLATVPATVQATNPHPYATAVLWLQYNSDAGGTGCGYRCPASGGVCTSNTLNLVGACTYGTSYPGAAGGPGAGGNVAFTYASLTIQANTTGAPVPSTHGPIEVDAAIAETGTCPSGCAEADLDDEDACTIDQCVLQGGFPTIVRTDMCADTPLLPGVATTVGDALGSLLEGPNPVQREADVASIDLVRAAGITGKVWRHDGHPAAGARVEIAGHEEYGWTETDGNGEYVMLVEGGGSLTVNVDSPGYLPVHRQVQPDWQGWAHADDVVLTPLSPVATQVDLSTITSIAAAVGTVESDDVGARQGTLLFRPGATATLRFADNTTQPISSLTVRSTEYTVGEDGPARMPAPLPPQVAYTYAVELSVDEAAGAAGVEFGGVAQPVVYYLEATKFLPFPVGSRVPQGHYDRIKKAWVAEDNGRVIQVIGESIDQATGLAVANVDVDGIAGAELTIDGHTLSVEERAKLAELYEPNDVLWRLPVTHFSPKDLNWIYLADGSCKPGECDGEPDAPAGNGPEPSSCEKAGSIIECENQVLGERIPIPGTGLTLNYRSDRTPGNLGSRQVTVPLTESIVPSNLRRVRATLEVGGRVMEQTLVCGAQGCAASQSADLTWDGRDRFGRTLRGRQPAIVSWSYVFPAVYAARPASGVTRSWATWGEPGQSAGVDAVYGERVFTRKWSIQVGTWDARAAGLGGWTLSGVHAFDPLARMVHYGDGGRRSVDPAAPRIRAIVPEGGGERYKVAGLPDGSVMTVRAGYLLRVERNGAITTLESVGSGAVLDLQAAPDGTLFMAKSGYVKRRNDDGTWTPIAGNGTTSNAFACTGQDGTAAILAWNVKIAPDAEGNVYVASLNYICKLGRDGKLQRVAGDGVSGTAGQNIPAATTGGAVRVGGISGMAVGPDGALYFATGADYAILRRITADGMIQDVVGARTGGSSGPSIGALTASAKRLGGISFRPDGSLFVTEERGTGWASSSQTSTVRVVRDGMLSTIAGTAGWLSSPECNSGAGDYCGDGGPAAAALLRIANSLAFRPDGSLVVGQYTVVTQIEPSLPGLGLSAYSIPSEDGALVDIFDPVGRLSSTRDALTGAVVRTVGYDAQGRVDFIDDRDGRRVDIAHDADVPTLGETSVTITGPDGAASVVVVDAGGWLRRLENPEAEVTEMGYDSLAPGLLKWLQKPANTSSERSEFDYDSLGRLVEDRDPTGQAQTLSRAPTADGWTVTHQSPLGLPEKYRVSKAASGVRERSVTNAASSSTTLSTTPDEVRTLTYPDGSTRKQWLAPDPRLGSLAPFVRKEEMTIPGVGTRKIIRTRTRAGASSPTSLWDFTSLTERTWINPLVETPALSAPHFSTVFAASSRTETVASPVGRTSLRIRDARARVATWTPTPYDPVVSTFDAATGRLLATTQGSGASARESVLGYGADGRVSSVSNAVGDVTTLDWDEAGRIREETRLMGEPGSTDDEATLFAYDDNGNLVSLTPPGETAHGLAHDARDLLATYEPPLLDADPAAWKTEYVFDADKRLDAASRPDGVLLDYVYGLPSPITSASGKLIAVDAGAPWKNTTSYDPVGRVQSLAGPRWTGSSPEQALAYTYAGPLQTSERYTGAVGGVAGVDVSWTYNSFHLPATESVGGQSIAFTYDADGLLTSAGELTIGRSTQTGQVTSVSSTSGGHTVLETRTYDPGFGELASIDFRYDGAPFFTLAYTRDALGRIATMTETIDGGTPALYEYFYDEAGRLTDVEKDTLLAEHYAYDKNGNRTRAEYPPSAVVRVGTYDAQDRLETYGPWDFAYTAHGELESRLDGTSGIETDYDPFGSLVSAAVDGSGTPSLYENDARGRRLQTSHDGTLVGRWIWRSTLQPAAELDATNAVVARYVYADGVNAPDLVVAGSERWCLVKDHLGSVRMVVDVATGEVLRRMDFDAFGRVLNLTADDPGMLDADIVPFGFAGGMWDSDTGLVRFGARDYDPETGRWTAKDPIRFDGGQANLYAYVGNDPVNHIDPTGLRSWFCSVPFAGLLCDVFDGPDAPLCVGPDCMEFPMVPPDDAGSSACPAFPEGDPDFEQCKNSTYRETSPKCCERVCGRSYPDSSPGPGAPPNWPGVRNPGQDPCIARCMSSVAP